MREHENRPAAQSNDSGSGFGSQEVIARFTAEDEAEAAAEALRQIGYRPAVSRMLWEPVERQARGPAATMLIGGGFGMLVGTLLAAGWWALSGAYNQSDGLQLPIGRALSGVVLYLICALIGMFLGYRYGIRLQRTEAAARAGTDGPHYAVSVPLTRTAMEREDIQRILEQHRGEDVEVRRIA